MNWGQHKRSPPAWTGDLCRCASISENLHSRIGTHDHGYPERGRACRHRNIGHHLMVHISRQQMVFDCEGIQIPPVLDKKLGDIFVVIDAGKVQRRDAMFCP